MCRHGFRRLRTQKLAVLKVFFCILVLCYLLWTYWRNVVLFVRFVSQPEYRECVHRRRNYELEGRTDPLYVTLAIHGRLGNWMYGYASLIGIARANGYTPYLSPSHPLNTYFVLSNKRDEPAECLRVVYDDRPCAYNPEFMNLPNGNVSIEGYIQSWKYFKLVEHEVRKEFQLSGDFKTRVLKQFSKLVEVYIREGRTIISIHVRRGDVLKPEARKLGFCHAPKSYFDKAMKHMLDKFPHSAFLVMSDDIPWCQENLNPPKVEGKPVPIVFSPGYSMGTDFGMLTVCNHSIVSVGTFGWWGAWLANGHVVYYKDFPLPGTKIDYETVKEDFFPEHWVAISSCVTVTISHSLMCLLLVFAFRCC
ncbi:galactoside alpha-(1,2)-fucosyltransferase 2 [Aplysia californica]|uniref:L-Fucosyltransferase n=1 Tax=Aplysia californica TaxID=6500 RepID=A0ABM0K3C4_APLCA|nr:galactoside alpha-(1,2)-fucosyltransferase 2 [Aplysia californica]